MRRKEYYEVPSICMECENGDNWGNCSLLPIEEEVCLDNEGELFVPREEENGGE